MSAEVANDCAAVWAALALLVASAEAVASAAVFAELALLVASAEAVASAAVFAAAAAPRTSYDAAVAEIARAFVK